MTTKLKMGMVGGGIGSFIGDVHRKAALLDGKIELSCGAFSSNAQRSLDSALKLGLPEHKAYKNFEQMIVEEAKLPESERMDFVSIVTPNHVHFPPAKLAMEYGFPVICDKPVTLNLQEALDLKKIIEDTGQLFALTHTYTGYPMVKQGKKMIENGDLGEIRRVNVHYLQGWMSTAVEETDNKQAAWRMDPSQSGKGGAIGDIGTHAENLVEFMTGIEIESLAADLTSFGKGRVLDDDANFLIRLENGAKGVLTCSQIATGEENNLTIQIYGTKGSMEWHQENPNELIVRWLDQAKQIYTPGGNGNLPYSANYVRIPSGHPEGFLEAFANIYRDFADEIIRKRNGESFSNPLPFPSIDDGIKGMQFIDAAVESSENNSAWVNISSKK